MNEENVLCDVLEEERERGRERKEMISTATELQIIQTFRYMRWVVKNSPFIFFFFFLFFF